MAWRRLVHIKKTLGPFILSVLFWTLNLKLLQLNTKLNMPSTRSTLNLKRKSIRSLLLPNKKRQLPVSFKIYNFSCIQNLQGEHFPLFGKTKKNQKFVPVIKFEDIEGKAYLCVRKFFYETRTYSSSFHYFLLPRLRYCSCEQSFPVVLPELEAQDLIEEFSIKDEAESDTSSGTLPVPHGESYFTIEQ